MPVDLDELFAALNHHADAVPLAPAETVIRRGRQRRRRQRVLASVAAVLVLFTGVGAVARWNRAPAPLPAAPDGRIRGMSAITDPIRFGGSDLNTWRQTGSSGGLIFSVSELSGGENRVVALDATSGAVLWTDGQHDFAGTEPGLIAVPGGPLLVAAPHQNPVEPGMIDVSVLDPSTGRSTLSLGGSPGTQLVLADGVMVSQAVTGWTNAHSLGQNPERLWRVTHSGDRAVLTVGTSGALESGYPGLSMTLSGRDVVQVTTEGRVLVRDVRTGKVRRTLATGLTGADAAVTGDGRLFTRHGRSIRATPLAGGKPVTVWTAPAGRKPQRFLSCGTDLLCVTDGALLTTIDTGSGKVLREATATGEPSVRGSRVLVGDGTTTTVFDETGRLVFTGPGRGRWIDDTDVLLQTGDTVSVVSATDGRRTDLGAIPDSTGSCTSSAEFLACPTGPTMRLWRFDR